MQVGDLVKIRDNGLNRHISNWMIQAQKSGAPLLIVGQRPPNTPWPKNQVAAQVKVVYNGQVWWVWTGALEELSKKCK